jgi:hypothetical protein
MLPGTAYSVKNNIMFGAEERELFMIVQEQGIPLWTE